MGFLKTRIYEEASSLLEKGEEIKEAERQSLLSSITPCFFIATDKRIIIIHNTFWGLYAGRNLISPADYNYILYEHITTVVQVRGKFLSSLMIRLRGQFEAGVTLTRNEGEMDGLWHKDATHLVKFIDSMAGEVNAARHRKNEMEANLHSASFLSAQRNSLYSSTPELQGDDGIKVSELSLGEATSMVKGGGTKFVWLGTEPVGTIKYALGTDADKIIKLNPGSITELDKGLLETLRGCVFVCYNGSVSAAAAKYLEKTHGINVHILGGGIVKIAVHNQ